MMEEETIRRRRWLTHAEFLDLLGATNLIPGPNSTQMAIQIGYRMAGWKGLILAGVCFVIPAVAITLLLAVLYSTYGTVPAAGPLLLEAVAIGQCTPGPLLSTATFVGYLIRGVPGALVATACIFAPSFVLVSIVGPFVPKLRRSSTMSGFLDGVNSAALGLMLAVIVQFVWSPNPAWIIAGSALLGWIFSTVAILGPALR